MPSFRKEFMQSKGQPIVYNGETLYLCDYIPVPKEFTVSVRLISTASEWNQIIRLQVKKTGHLLCNGQKGVNFSFHQNTMPSIFEVSGHAPDEKLMVYNAWERKDWMDNDTVFCWAIHVLHIGIGSERRKCVFGKVSSAP